MYPVIIFTYKWEFFNFIRKLYTYPKKTYVENRGFDGSGVHYAKSNYKFQLIDNDFIFKKNKKKLNEINKKYFIRKIIKKKNEENFIKKIVKKYLILIKFK